MNEQPNEKSPVAKKPYAPPRLTVYGDLRMITENMRMTGNDGAGNPNHFST
jgi:hypothetical protein